MAPRGRLPFHGIAATKQALQVFERVSPSSGDRSDVIDSHSLSRQLLATNTTTPTQAITLGIERFDVEVSGCSQLAIAFLHVLSLDFLPF